MTSSFSASEWLPVWTAVTERPCETKYPQWASEPGVTQKQETQAAGLMLRAQQGEEAAYTELLVLLTAATRSYVRSRVGRLVPWIDDAVQETLVAVHHARHTFDGRRPFAPWFYAIARNRFVDVLRREQRVRQHELSGTVWPELAGAPDDGTTRVDMDAVRRALASLPSRQREVVEAIKLRDESVRDIAARLDMTMTSVKVTAHRGYRTLRRLLGADLREE
jgi:RNA polymerase sigma-70 factor, ECF subfamily